MPALCLPGNEGLGTAPQRRPQRKGIEAAVKAGSIRWVVCQLLDLGVDFQPVEQVVQIGSQAWPVCCNAGRSCLPGGTSQVLFMPTNALELLELSAVRADWTGTG